MPARASDRVRPMSPTSVATEVLLLRPRGGAEPPVEGDSTLWPLFVLVVTEPATPAGTLPLSGLLDRPKHENELSAVAVESAWSVLDPANAMLALTVRAAVPVAMDLKILLPAAPVLAILDVVDRGATIGITTRDRADRLRGRVDVRTALRDVLLLSHLPSADLAAVLRAAREH